MANSCPLFAACPRAAPRAGELRPLRAVLACVGGRCPCGAGSASTGAFKRSSKAVVASCMLSFVPTAWRAGRKSQRWGKSRILSYFVRLVTATRGPLPADVRHVSSPWVLHNAATPPRTRRVFYATSHRSILAQDRAGGGQAQAGRDRVASASPASPPRGHRDAYAAATISSLPTYVRIRAELKSSTFSVLRGASRRPAPTTSSCSAYGDRRSRSRGNPRAER